MNDGMNQTVEIDLKDLFCFVLKQTKALIIAAVIFGIAGAGFSYVKQKKAISAPAANILDTSVKQPGESDEAYNNRVANVERANDIMDNIAVLTKQVEIQNDYISNSVYMQIDPINTATSSVQVVITCDSGMVGGIDSLYNAYSWDILKGEYINSVADELGYDPGAVQELIVVSLISTATSYTDSQDQMGTLNVYVLGPSIDETELIMDAIVAEIESVSKDYNSSIMSHTVSLVGRQSAVGYDASVKKIQLDSVTTLNTLQTQINNLNNSLDSTAKTLGFTDKMDFYEPVNTATATQNSISVKSCIKYGLVGLVLGMVLVAGTMALVYVFGREIVSQSQFFSLFRGIESIGVCKPSDKRSKIQAFLDRISNDDSYLSEENTNKIVSANLNNLTINAKRVLITGTVDSDAIKESIKELDINADVKLDMFSNPEILKLVSEYDGVVIVEKRDISRKKMVKEQIKLLKNSGTKIIGAIIL